MAPVVWFPGLALQLILVLLGLVREVDALRADEGHLCNLGLLDLQHAARECCDGRACEHAFSELHCSQEGASCRSAHHPFFLAVNVRSAPL